MHQHPHTCPGCGDTHVLMVDLDLSPLVAILDRMNIKLRRLEAHMATATEQLTALSTKVDDLVADFRAFAAAVNTDAFSPEAQAAFDSLSAKIGGLDAEVGDADGSDTPPVEPPV